MQRVSLPHADRSCLRADPKFYSGISAPLRVDKCILVQDDYRNHRDIPALPFSQSKNTVPRPKPESYPKILKTIGDHIRTWRIDNHLLQAEIAILLSVCEDTVVGWEMRKTVPTTVRDWEKGKHIPSRKKRLKIEAIIRYME